MAQSRLGVFNKTLEKSERWIRDLMEDLGWEDEQKAYLALRSVLHALRDHLTVEEAAQLAAQMPMLIRGLFFEGWSPTGKPIRERHRDQFLMRIEKYFERDWEVSPETAAEAVFRLLDRHISKGETEDVQRILPNSIREMWTFF